MQRNALVIAVTLLGWMAGSIPVIADDDSLLLRTRVRYSSTNPQQPPVRRRAIGGLPVRYQTGDTVRVSVTDREKPLDVLGGSVRIRSASSGYDSGEQALVHEQDGRSLYFQWRTSKLKPASDYRIDAVVRMKGGGTKSRQIDVALHPVIVEQPILERTTDLALPYWSLGLHLTRRFRYESVYGIYGGPLGYGWIHAYGVLLSEDTDGSLSLFDTSTGGTGYFRPTTPGSYESAAGDDSRLTRDPDGVFHLRLANGDLWRFRSDLKPAFLQDARGRRVSFEYDPRGRLGAAVDGSGQRVGFTYDTVGRIVSAADSTGRSVAYVYDPQGHLEQFRDVAGAITRYRYDNRHRLTEIVFSDGRTRSFEYGDYGRLSRLAEHGGAGSFTFTYNLSNPTHGERTIADAHGRPLRELSSGDGFLTETRDAIGNTVVHEYDGDFHRSRFVDAKGNAWAFASDVEKGRDETTDPLGNKTAITYSPDDRQIASVKDGNGRETRFGYSGGELELTTFADGRLERRSLAQDGARLIEERIRRGGQLNRYVFDARGLLLRKELHDGSASTYAYDARGNMTGATNAAGTIAMERDVRGRLVSVTYPGPRVFRYEYDDRSRLVKTIMPDGEVVSYGFDEPGRLQRVTRGQDVVASYEYNLALQPTRRILGNGVTTDYAYDGAGRLTSLMHRRENATLSSWTYTLDANGRRGTKTGTDGSESYLFDKAGRLTNVSYADTSTEAFEYDAGGNRTSMTKGAVRAAVSANALNQYTAIGDERLDYDLNGNLSSWTRASGTTRFTWDPEDRLTSVKLANGATIAYTYDALGRLRSRTDALGARLFLWDRMQIAVEEDLEHKTLRSYIGSGRLDDSLEMRESGQRFFYLHDALGSVTEVTNAAGFVTERHRYRAFGEESTAAVGSNPFLFTAALLDRATGLHYFRNRWYSPAQGRFIQVDPIGVAGGINLYAYVLNDPVNQTDPLGLCGKPPDGPPGEGDCPDCDGGNGKPPVPRPRPNPTPIPTPKPLPGPFSGGASPFGGR